MVSDHCTYQNAQCNKNCYVRVSVAIATIIRSVNFEKCD